MAKDKSKQINVKLDDRYMKVLAELQASYESEIRLELAVSDIIRLALQELAKVRGIEMPVEKK